MPSITLTNPTAGNVVTAGLHATNYSALQTLLNSGLDGVNLRTDIAIALGALGLTIGTDVNLYRSVADVLKTDDSFTVGAQSLTLNKDGFIDLLEITEPAAAAANAGRLFLKDDGGGNTQLCIRFNTGATIVLATQGGSGASVDRVLITGFGTENLTSSLTNLQLTRFAGVVGAGAGHNIPAVMPRAGSITAISVGGNAARSGGTATFEVWKNGVATGLTVVIDATNTQYFFATQAAGTDTFVAGDRLDVRVTTTAAWAPTTGEWISDVEVQYS